MPKALLSVYFIVRINQMGGMVKVQSKHNPVQRVAAEQVGRVDARINGHG
jgi:hypothetical protein